MSGYAGPALGLGCFPGTVPADAGGAWIDADFVHGRFRFAGRALASEGEFRLAVGGTVPASGQLIIGPYVAETSPELLSDGNFASGGASDWLSAGSSVALASGALRVTGSGGNGSGAYRTIAGVIQSSGRAYRLVGEVWRETSSNVTLGFGAGSGGTVNYAQTANLTATTPSQAMLYCGGFNPSTASIALRHLTNPSTGIYWADNLSLREALPCAGFRAGALCGVVEARTPASGGAGGVLFQADDNAEFNGNWFERNFIRLIWDASQHLRFVVSFGGSGTQVEQVNLDLGVVPAGSAFSVGFSAREGNYFAALVGQPVQQALSGTFPGLAALRLGRGRSGVSGLWSGNIARVRLFSEPLGAEQFAALVSGTGVVAWGDSLTAGAGATGGSTGGSTYPAVAQSLFSPRRAVVRQGVGGQTSTQIAARMNAVPLLVTVADGAIPPSGPAAVIDKSVNVLVGSGGYTGSLKGWLAGVEGTISTDSSGNWSFIRSVAGTSVPVTANARFICAWGQYLRGYTAWLWLGRNGAQAGRSVLGDIAAAVASLGHGPYLVGGILPSTGDSGAGLTRLATLNGQLASTYGDRFVNLLSILCAAANGSADDSSDVAAGFVPRSLRSDHLHLNDAGYALVAQAFHAAHVARGF
jgi:lysophospholipase L1-like esterase